MALAVRLRQPLSHPWLRKQEKVQSKSSRSITTTDPDLIAARIEQLSHHRLRGLQHQLRNGAAAYSFRSLPDPLNNLPLQMMLLDELVLETRQENTAARQQK